MKFLLSCLLAHLSALCIDAAPRESKQFLFFQPRSTTCRNNFGQEGFCLIQGCAINGLKASGRCGLGDFGHCCIVEKSCGGRSRSLSTALTNSNFPKTTTSLGDCDYTIEAGNHICQLRFDFLDFDLEQPNPDGVCSNDKFTIRGASSYTPDLCGENRARHMYVDVEPNSDITATVSITEISMKARRWNIKVNQIPCDSPDAAPRGCLQYFTNNAGVVNSFNYGNDPTDTGTRELANMAVSTCFKKQDGYCSMVFTENLAAGENSFSLSGDATETSYNAIGSRKQPRIDCTGIHDYLMISNAVDNNGNVVKWICGNEFPKFVRSEFSPFTIRHVTDGSEAKGDIGNKGFSLRYRQEKCLPSSILTGRYGPLGQLQEIKRAPQSSLFHKLINKGLQPQPSSIQGPAADPVNVLNPLNVAQYAFE